MAVEVAATRRRFTRAEYYRMAEVGILGRRDRVELIRGEIVEMSPIGPRHSAFVDNLNRLLARRLPDDAMVRVQGPVALADDTEPEPDLVVLRRRDVPYKEREAWAEDPLLVIEVGHSTSSSPPWIPWSSPCRHCGSGATTCSCSPTTSSRETAGRSSAARKS